MYEYLFKNCCQKLSGICCQSPHLFKTIVFPMYKECGKTTSPLNSKLQKKKNTYSSVKCFQSSWLMDGLIPWRAVIRWDWVIVKVVLGSVDWLRVLSSLKGKPWTDNKNFYRNTVPPISLTMEPPHYVYGQMY